MSLDPRQDVLSNFFKRETRKSVAIERSPITERKLHMKRLTLEKPLPVVPVQQEVFQLNLH